MSLDGGALGADEARRYREVLTGQAEALATQVRPGDLVLLHDPQTAGLTAPLILLALLTANGPTHRRH